MGQAFLPAISPWQTEMSAPLRLRTEWPAAAALLAKTARDHPDASIRQLAASILAGEEDGKDEFGN